MWYELEGKKLQSLKTGANSLLFFTEKEEVTESLQLETHCLSPIENIVDIPSQFP